MNKKKYLAMREQLMNDAQQLINEGKAEEAQNKMQEVTALDAKWDAIAQAQANMNALNEEPIFINSLKMEDATGETDIPVTPERAWASKEYERAWAKNMMGKQMTPEEHKCFEMVNESYTHTTKNTQIVIPENMSKHIWEPGRRDVSVF